jgi:hypothetical protein
MSPYKIHLSLAAVVLAVTAFLPQCVHAQYWTNGQAASFVIGQTGFNLNGNAATPTGLYNPVAVIQDPVSGKIFVSDWNNSRVLRYPSTAAMTNGAAAEAVFGQPDLFSTDTTSTATGLSGPEGIAMDAAGNLWVVDQNNQRVVRYANAATVASGAAASSILGVAGPPVNGAQQATASSFLDPSDVFAKGTSIWVADTYNSRVLRFDNAASKPYGAPADAVFGQYNFVSNQPGGGASGVMGWPTALYVDGSDNLWVTDARTPLVEVYPNASTAPNGENNTNLWVGIEEGMNPLGSFTDPYYNSLFGVTGDAAGNIYVSDFYNNRILIYANGINSNSSFASAVLGQFNFNTSGSGDSADQLSLPYHMYVNPAGTMLLAADPENNRVLVFIPPVVLPLLLTSFTGRLQDNGQVLLQWQISGAGGTGGGPGNAGTTTLEYSTTDTSGFTDVLNTQPVNPAVSGYSYVQVSPVAGPNYYRVKLTAPDGLATYSQIVTITVSGATGLSIYPNPAQRSVVVTVAQSGGATAGIAAGGATAGGVTSGTAEIGIYSSKGILMQRLVTGAAVNHIDISRLAAGVYTVRVVQGGHATSGSFVKMN